MKLTTILIAAALAGPAAAQTAPAPTPAPAPAKPAGMADKLINSPMDAWNIYGTGQTNVRDDKGGPQGYPAVRVTVAAKTANPWDVGALAPVAKPIAAGDVLFVAVYLRAPMLKDGETTALPFLGLTTSSAPYTPVATGTAAVTNQWKRYYASGKAAAAYAPANVNAALHLGADKHVIDIGPILIYDLGPDFDVAKLPH